MEDLNAYNSLARQASQAMADAQQNYEDEMNQIGASSFLVRQSAESKLIDLGFTSQEIEYILNPL